jgi:hypothetical protein
MEFMRTVDRILPNMIFVSSLDFSEISKGRRVTCVWKFLKGGSLNRLQKFTGQGSCFHIHSKEFLGNMCCFWDSVDDVGGGDGVISDVGEIGINDRRLSNAATVFKVQGRYVPMRLIPVCISLFLAFLCAKNLIKLFFF